MTLKIKQSRVLLEGVATYDAVGDTFSDVRALTAALRFLGEAVDLKTMLAVSGEAFRMGFSTEGWRGASAYVSRYAPLAAGARAFGYQPRYIVAASADETWMAVCDAIDAGRPALSAGALSGEDSPLEGAWFLLVGYERHGHKVALAGLPAVPGEFRPLPALHGRECTWLGMVKGLEVAPTVLAERPVFCLGMKGQEPDDRARAAETIARALRLSQDATLTVPPEHPVVAGRYVVGLAGYRLWAEHLGRITGQEAPFRGDPREGSGTGGTIARINLETAGRVRRGRRAAADFLRRSADLFESAVHDALLSAAAGYTEVAELADEFISLFAAATPYAAQNLLLDRVLRTQGVVLIRQMQALEAAAVVQLEAAQRRIDGQKTG